MSAHTLNPPTRRTRGWAKARAKALRSDAIGRGEAISHAQALEQVAKELGFRDWNTAAARLPHAEDLSLQLGDTVSGNYLKQPYTGRVIGLKALAASGSVEVTLHFDRPVDVVQWESFSSHRQRVTALVKPDGTSWSKTSDGEPHLTVWPGVV